MIFKHEWLRICVTMLRIPIAGGKHLDTEPNTGAGSAGAQNYLLQKQILKEQKMVKEQKTLNLYSNILCSQKTQDGSE